MWNKFKDWISGRAAIRKMIYDYEIAFPDRCVICGYHRYGINQGLIKYETPLPYHKECKEGKIFNVKD